MPRPGRGSASYRAVLARPHARGLFAAAMLARLCYGLLGLPLLLALREGTGSYALAGTATGLFGLVGALLGPARARLVQRHRPALLLLAVAYALGLSALAAACALHAPVPLTVGLAVLAGLLPPPVGPLMRTLWGRLTEDEAERQCALSLDTAAESTVFALGPVAGGLLAALVSAPAVLVGCAALVLAGFGLLTSALRRAPEGVRDTAAGSAGRGGPLLAAGFRPLLVLVWAVAAALAASEIALVAAWGTATAGALTALFSVGGVAGGLVYGRHRWPGPLTRRPPLLTAASALCYAVLALDLARPTAGAALLAAGACADVLLITVYQLVDDLVPEGSRTEAGAWLNTAYNLGAALGAAAGGVQVDHAGPRASFAATAGLVGLCAVLCLPFTARRRTVAGPRTPAAPPESAA